MGRPRSHPLLLFFGANTLSIEAGLEMLIEEGLVSDQAITKPPEGITGHLERLKQINPAQTMEILEHFNATSHAPEGYYIP